MKKIPCIDGRKHYTILHIKPVGQSIQNSSTTKHIIPVNSLWHPTAKKHWKDYQTEDNLFYHLVTQNVGEIMWLKNSESALQPQTWNQPWRFLKGCVTLHWYLALHDCLGWGDSEVVGGHCTISQTCLHVYPFCISHTNLQGFRDNGKVWLFPLIENLLWHAYLLAWLLVQRQWVFPTSACPWWPTGTGDNHGASGQSISGGPGPFCTREWWSLGHLLENGLIGGGSITKGNMNMDILQQQLWGSNTKF